MKYYLVLTFFIYSCATQTISQKTVLTKESFNKNIQSICLLGEGKGKMIFGDKRQVFSYDSLFRESEWIMELSVPFRGAEYFKIEQKGSKLGFSGSFYQLLKANFTQLAAHNPEYNKGDLKRLLGFVANELFKVREFKKKFQANNDSYFDSWCTTAPNLECSHQNQGTDYKLDSESFRATKKVGEYTLSWVNSHLKNSKDSRFQKSIFSLSRSGRGLLETSFYPSKCENDS